MKIVQPNFKIWNQNPSIEGVYEMIERVGRTCYASDPIEGKAKDFVDRMIKNQHNAMLEHGTIYLTVKGDPELISKVSSFYRKNPYSKVVTCNDLNGYLIECYITTNYRVIIENNLLNHLQFLSEPTKSHEKRITVHFSTQIAISREYNRHRVNSIGEQSTRYCNYSDKNKFEGVGINIPTWVAEDSKNCIDSVDINFTTLKEEYFAKESSEFISKKDWNAIDWWLWSILVAEESYLNMITLGKTPQEARVVLPLCTNTELTHTAFISDWKHFFDLRALGTTGKPHPDAKVLALPLLEEFKKQYLI